jgi:hypothetical protein
MYIWYQMTSLALIIVSPGIFSCWMAKKMDSGYCFWSFHRVHIFRCFL